MVLAGINDLMEVALEFPCVVLCWKDTARDHQEGVFSIQAEANTTKHMNPFWACSEQYFLKLVDQVQFCLGYGEAYGTTKW